MKPNYMSIFQFKLQLFICFFQNFVKISHITIVIIFENVQPQRQINVYSSSLVDPEFVINVLDTQKIFRYLSTFPSP